MGGGRRVNMTKKSKQRTGSFILKKAPKHDKKEAQHHDINVMLGFLLNSIPQLRGNRGYFGA